MKKNDLSQKELIIYQYMKNALEGEIDPYDLRTDSAFTEMFLSPQIDLFLPILTYLDDVRFAQSLSNPELISDDRMDEIGELFNNSRKMGQKSHGYITMVFDDIPDNGYITIPKGMTVRTKNDLIFVVERTYMFDEISIAKHYDASDFLYKIPVYAYSQGLGEEYNIRPNEITAVDSRSPDGLISVTNESNFVGGKNTETNAMYANRLRREMWSKNLGITRGYQVMVHSFEGVIDAEIVGYRHPYMKRDVIGDVSIPGVTMHEGISKKHWGSKVDIYIRGEKDEEVTESLEIQKTKDGELFVELTTKPVTGVSSVSITPENLGLDPREVDYERLVINNYDLEKDDDFETFGTLEEDVVLKLNKIQAEGDFELKPGNVIDVTYRYNAIPQQITDHMYNSEEENRPPTADVKVKLAHKKYVALSIAVGMLEGVDLQLSDEISIRTHLRENIEDVPMGGELQISDLIEHMYTDDMDDRFNNVDYIELPFRCLVFEKNRLNAFSSLNGETKELLEGYLFEDTERKPVYEEITKRLTTTEVLDLLHIFSRRNAIVPDPKDDVAAERFERYQSILDAYKAIDLHNILSPSTVKAEPIQHFELIQTKVEDLNFRGSTAWVDFDPQIQVLAQVGEEGEAKLEELALVVFAISLGASDDTDEDTIKKKLDKAKKMLGLKENDND